MINIEELIEEKGTKQLKVTNEQVRDQDKEGELHDLVTKLENKISNLNIKIESLEAFPAENSKLKEQSIALTMENKHLKEVIKTLEKCNQCDKDISEKDALKRHIQMNHEEKEFKCNNCEKHFKTNHSTQQHLNSKHAVNDNKMELLMKEGNLKLQISQQREKLHETLYRLKKKEVIIGSKCICKGHCYINHSKHRFIQSRADTILIKLASITCTEKN